MLTAKPTKDSCSHLATYHYSTIFNNFIFVVKRTVNTSLLQTFIGVYCNITYLKVIFMAQSVSRSLMIYLQMCNMIYTRLLSIPNPLLLDNSTFCPVGGNQILFLDVHCRYYCKYFATRYFSTRISALFCQSIRIKVIFF